MGYLSATRWCAVVVLLTACGGGGDGSPTDPLFKDQWHLKNTGQLGANGVVAKVGEDINVEPVWNSCGLAATCRGEGIRIAVVDDGMEILHEDLAANVAAGLSFNYLTGGNDPTPPSGSGEAHGTGVSGIIAARDLNNRGVRGVAPRAGLVGFNLLQNLSSSNEADAMTRGSPDVHIFSNSWGAQDGTGLLADAPFVWRTAIDTGLSTGRAGKGAVYVWAAGNGARGSGNCADCVDNSNYDGRANYRGVIAVGAVNNQGTKSSYSEPGANILVSAPGGEFCDTHTISTTDLSGEDGVNPSGSASVADYTDTNYSKCMNGTSAATPVVSGVVALVLQANSTLSYRDVRSVLANSARKNDPSDGDWTVNGAGLNINHNYGFGVVNADAAVTLAKTWTNLSVEKTHESPLITVNTAIPDNDTTGVSSITAIVSSTISKIESIEIIFSSTNHTYSGDLEITLTNVTTGTISRLSERHVCVDRSCSTLDGWVFSSVRHLGEAADGDWRLTVKDLAASDTGTFQSWRIIFYGT